jgi:hypothetical protein
MAKGGQFSVVARGHFSIAIYIHIIDATHMTAKVDLFRLKKEHQDGDDDDHYVDCNSPDPVPVQA